MTFSTMTVGRLTLAEALRPGSDQLNMNTGLRTVAFAGQESQPPLTLAELFARHEDLVNLPASFVPVVLADKSRLTGYYRVVDAGSELMAWQGEVTTAEWALKLERVGSEHEVDIETRLSGAQSRVNNFTVTGERWHAPPIGHYGYFAGSTVPTVVTRTGADGAITVYRGIPLATHPRFGCPVASYMNGRVRFLDSTGIERSGVDLVTTPAGWELSNGLVRVKPLAASGVLEVAAYSGGAYQPIAWDVLSGGTTLGAIDSVTLLRNEPEMVVLRVMWLLAGPGRVTADLTLRRGSRFVEVFVESFTSATLAIRRFTAAAGAQTSGYVTATANDGAGNRYIIGSAKTFTADAVNGGVSLAATTRLDAFIGAVVGGSGAVAGDQAANLMAQYIGAPSERVEGVRR